MTRADAMVAAAVCVFALAHLSPIGAVQSGQRPVRDLRVEPSGSGAISGVVQEESESKRPLRRAMVRLSGDQLFTARQTLTRDDGTFMFDGLPAGQYNLSAQRSSYMTAEFGARRPGGTGSAIALANGQRLADIVLRLSPFGSITGMVYDQDGEPAPNISVEALKYTMRTGRRTLSSVYGQPSTTDDRGVYRVGGLAPGEYFIAAGPSPDRGPMDVQRLTTADLDRVMQILTSPATTAASVAFDEPHQGFAPVYFPGSMDFSRAQPIVLTVGEDRGGVDLRLQLVRMATVDGKLTSPDGRAVTGVQIVATPVTEASSLDLFSPATVAPAAADAQGRFRFPAVAPGHYMVSARMPAAPGGQAGPLWATADLSISGGNQTIALTLQPGMAVSGKVIFSGGTLQPPANMTGVRVTMASTQRVPNFLFSDPLGVGTVNVNPDGTFTLTGASPGSYRLSVTLPGSSSGWALRSAFVNGADSLDTPFAVTPGRSFDDAVVIFTDRPTDLSGTLQTPAGTPTADYFIMVFATDQAFWSPSSRRNVSARPASSGKYSVRNLPPGEYFIVAVTDVEQGDWWDPSFLERLAPVATRFTLSEGERKTLDLKIGG